ncbi:hypothetical protein [Rhodovibrio sodomensis]|uniref:hypothetical protein n=1 Tax=Rhodovibrio sodomensis TaxID=1088 RepID=UPI001903DF15|nr:hypothetical protein [Rhodovibrio sodomensis]
MNVPAHAFGTDANPLPLAIGRRPLHDDLRSAIHNGQDFAVAVSAFRHRERVHDSGRANADIRRAFFGLSVRRERNGYGENGNDGSEHKGRSLTDFNDTNVCIIYVPRHFSRRSALDFLALTRKM